MRVPAIWTMRPLTPALHDAIAAGAPPMMSCGESPAARRCNDTAWALYAETELVGMGGLIPYWPGNSEAWCVIPPATPRRLAAQALPEVRRWLDLVQHEQRIRRIGAFIRWNAGYRRSFADALGFVLEGVLEAWGPDGADFGLYVRLRDG